MGSKIFKYRKGPNYSYAPGEVNAGTDGSKGISGDNGPGIYFVDYDLNNSKNKDIALQKINNGFLLGSDSRISVGERAYKEGDMIISSSLNCYRLVLREDNSFDIEYLGTIRNNANMALNSISKVVVYDLTDTVVNFHLPDGSIHTTRYDSQYLSPIPTNSSLPYNSNKSLVTSNMKLYDLMTTGGRMGQYEHAFAKYGKWYKIVIYMNVNDYENYKNIKFNIVDELKCEKSQVGEAYDLGTGDTCAIDDFKGCIKHHKSLIFNGLPVIEDNQKDTKFIFNEAIWEAGQTKMNDASVNTVFISATLADRLHTYSNDYKVSLIRMPNGDYYDYKPSNGWAKDASISQAAIDSLNTTNILTTENISSNIIGSTTYFGSIASLLNGKDTALKDMDNFFIHNTTAYAYISENEDDNSDNASEINVINVNLIYDDKYAGKTIDASLNGEILDISVNP